MWCADVYLLEDCASMRVSVCVHACIGEGEGGKREGERGERERRERERRRERDGENEEKGKSVATSSLCIKNRYVPCSEEKE